MVMGSAASTALSGGRRRRRSRARRLSGAAALGVVALLALPAATAHANPSGNDWAQYSFDHSGTNFTDETLITPANAGSLKAVTGWKVTGGGVISSRPIVANNLVYWGTWDGLEHATPIPGSSAVGWTTPLGVTTGTCFAAGVASTPAAVTVAMGGQSTPVLFLFLGGGGNDAAGGGFAKVYALNA